jgi:cystathionine beta-lyase/cystathionine gamma-synthase
MEYSPGVRRHIEKANQAIAARQAYRAKMRTLKFDTIAVHGMYSVDEAFSGGQGGVIEPIFPSTSQAYRDSDEMEAGLAYLIPTWCYSRIHNPTIFYLEETLALLESYDCGCDASALCTSSGMSAIKQAIEPLLAKTTRRSASSRRPRSTAGRFSCSTSACVSAVPVHASWASRGRPRSGLS